MKPDIVPVKTIYTGGYVPDLGIVSSGGYKGWLVYRGQDGQWVTLADLKQHSDLITPEETSDED
jgi:hypothetical protein